MECDVCHTRSSAGYCAECNKLLCEECAVTCSRCGSLVCPDHMHETRSGRLLCAECVRERQERRSKYQAAKAAVAADEEAAVADEAEAEEEVEVLTASAAKVISPWTLSVSAGGAALVIVVVAIFFPYFRVVSFGWTSALVIMVAVGGAFWGVVGLIFPRYYEDRSRSLLGVVLAVAALGCAVFGIAREAKVALEEKALREAGPRAYLKSDAERKEYKDTILRGELPAKGE
ncbi:MAG TPA: hypothetical protein HPP77_07360 [Candidatus Hydrogenedentes bacterium]|nr:hypothetical protein [Candidatus Hydrogenedentota bacterium]HIJ74236.1 hypothetical protein [Candidatus Hydrogenedentota bacterium]